MVRRSALWVSLMLTLGCDETKTTYDTQTLRIDLRACLGTGADGPDGTDAGIDSRCRETLDDNVRVADQNACLLIRNVTAGDVYHVPMRWAGQRMEVAEAVDLPLGPGTSIEAELYFVAVWAAADAPCGPSSFDYGQACPSERQICALKLSQGRTTVSNAGLAFDFFDEESGACRAEGPLTDVGGMGAEICDGSDNDCDGLVDESDPDVGATCETGLPGPCASGETICCDASGVAAGRCPVAGARHCRPGVVPGERPEICDGSDNNCDGATDEDIAWTPEGGEPVPLGEVCVLGEGECRREGVVVCDGTLGATCDAEVAAPAEVDRCDGLDNDCDGEVDEDHQLGAICQVGAGQCVRTGVTVCDDEDGTVVCNAEPGAPEFEQCDGLDNDCDEQIDEDFEALGVGLLCSVGAGACRAEGTNVCSADGGGVVCDAVEGAASPEICGNGRDEDCDGEVDENFAALGQSCVVGIGACRREGVQICDPADATRMRCSVEAGVANADDPTCDGRDDDCDGLVDESYVGAIVDCGEGACSETGRLICQGGGLITTCREGTPAADDATCDAVDDDCDGRADEDFALVETQCGVGECAERGVSICLNGALQDTCQPGQPGADDRTCDGRDDDCDGERDEDYIAPPTACGTGACVATGQRICVDGGTFDTCTPGAAALDDVTCDAIDDDCDGLLDESYASENTTCGVGQCRAQGLTACVGGNVVDSCVPNAPEPNDATCDGRDEDCDDEVDDDYVEVETTCGRGACAAAGRRTCVDGAVRDSCVAGAPAADDATCDAVDDDCDGLTDEDFVSTPTECGGGACSAAGTTICVEGQVLDTCRDGQPAIDDPTCDGVDDDCDGAVDEDYVPIPTACGIGACARTGERVCVGGRPQDTCSPGSPQADDSDCDDVDDDCDGMADEDFPVTPTECGTGVCRRNGVRRCLEGAEIDNCAIGVSTGDDSDCDGLDDDCNGLVDDHYAAAATACGVGECAAVGRNFCINGAVQDSCQPRQPGVGDASCDGRDNDCDGQSDEDFVGEATTCGTGECHALGVEQCVDGRVIDTCAPGEPAVDDATCDGADDNCNALVDEDFVGAPTVCGEGACGDRGETICVRGEVRDTCRVGAPALDDPTCDGQDDDCDGQTDENYVPVVTACGTGACANNGRLLCVQGRAQDSCAPLIGTADDATCDGIDDDCDEQVDEEYSPRNTACGVGECAAVGVTRCEAGDELDDCAPGIPADMDLCGNSRDEDCDGQTDEGFPDLGDPCAVGVGECRREGVMECAPDGRSTRCGAVAGEPAPNDLCDGRDNDCDGQVDEADSRVGQACDTGQPGACSAGIFVCDAGALECPVRVAGGAETCDGTDEDCDGEIDEDFPIGLACSVGVGACARDGIRACSADGSGTDCDAVAGIGSEEICNGEDDDCDGQTDEADPALGTVCNTGNDGICGPGTRICAEGALACVADEIARAETCDGTDENCDGSIDEGFGLGDACNVGVGACAADGTLVCGPGGDAVCDAVEGAPGVELCNDVDDDCDGPIDEDADCGGYVETHCEAWLIWSDASNAVDGPVDAWEQCDASGGTDFVSGYRCVSGHANGTFYGFAIRGDLGAGDRIGVRFTCLDAEAPLHAAYVESHCGVYVGYGNDSDEDARASDTWGPCPAADRGASGDQLCVSSQGDGQYHAIELADDVGAGGDDEMAVAFRCADPDSPARAATLTAAIDVFLGWDALEFPARIGAASWDGCPAAQTDDEGNIRCAASGGDGRFHTFRLPFDVSGGDGNNDRLGIGLIRR